MRNLSTALLLTLAVGMGGCDSRYRSSEDATAVEESGDKITVNYIKKDGAIETFNKITMDGVWGCHSDEDSEKTKTVCEKLEFSRSITDYKVYQAVTPSHVTPDYVRAIINMDDKKAKSHAQ